MCGDSALIADAVPFLVDGDGLGELRPVARAQHPDAARGRALTGARRVEHAHLTGAVDQESRRAAQPGRSAEHALLLEAAARLLAGVAQRRLRIRPDPGDVCEAVRVAIDGGPVQALRSGDAARVRVHERAGRERRAVVGRTREPQIAARSLRTGPEVEDRDRALSRDQPRLRPAVGELRVAHEALGKATRLGIARWPRVDFPGSSSWAPEAWTSNRAATIHG
jgi:hypothetical protein